MSKRQLKIVRLMEPELCRDCRFARRAEVEQADGTTATMTYCRRLDCDNWDSSASEPARMIRWEELPGLG